jgi:hypothetical protein
LAHGAFKKTDKFVRFSNGPVYGCSVPAKVDYSTFIIEVFWVFSPSVSVNRISYDPDT